MELAGWAGKGHWQVESEPGGIQGLSLGSGGGVGLAPVASCLLAGALC